MAEDDWRNAHGLTHGGIGPELRGTDATPIVSPSPGWVHRMGFILARTVGVPHTLELEDVVMGVWQAAANANSPLTDSITVHSCRQQVTHAVRVGLASEQWT
jgi:hypothetical protein